ncbi:integrase [Altererythrobacter atlanticus]|uniref:Site-specific tyrosine recombinase XerD n=1 Tax=Croceibacterium atlanticum TaxID=1267766 RepID=A0A0F7KZQ5_9SPHN|nr:tyrosine-type recombinase/integrase [Croceibacterium atlanticum]AKH44335.1 site-specific tyrosine recombinase XerD [Croceibacterium atlanticum]MBB5733949.1 integrase [Croceibacterium atlanticum]
MSDLVPIAPGSPVRFDAELLETARRAMSANSVRALQSDMRVFGTWCRARQCSGLPASPADIARFIRDKAAEGKKAATLARYVSSIARAHTLADLADPTRAELVRLELKAQRRELGVRQKQARGLRYRGEVADPRDVSGFVGVSVEAMLAAAPQGIKATRDKALLSLAFDTGLRRSEIVAAIWDHVESGTGGGGRLFVPRSKSDQEGAGTYAYLSPRTMQFLGEWQAASAKEGGAVFRRLHRAQRKTGEDVWSVGARITGQSVTLIYRDMLDTARAAGHFAMLSEAQYESWRRSLSAHSTRVGLTQDLFASGQDLAGIMHALRWKSPTQPARYAQALTAEANAAAKVVGGL